MKVTHLLINNFRGIKTASIIFGVHPANAYLDNLPAMKGIAKRHSREGGNPERAVQRGKTVLCLHHGKQTKRHTVYRRNIESGAKSVESQTGSG